MANNRDDDYKVGFGTPPLDTRFKKGKSGNPKGRAKGSEDFARLLEKTLRQRVTANVDGRRQSMTMLKAIITQLVTRAASGDQRKMKLLFELLKDSDQKALSNPIQIVYLNEEDRDI